MKSKLLFVDDEPHVLRGIQRMLWDAEEQYEIFTASSGAEAIDLIGNLDFAILLTDNNMPGMSGLQLIESVRQDPLHYNLPIVMLTGCNDRNLKRCALERGATDLLNKPIEPEDLVARIESVLKLQRYQDELSRRNEHLENMVRERTIQLEASRMEVVWRLSKAAETRDVETGLHTMRVGYYAQAIATAMECDAEYLDKILLAAPLHDIGKLGIPEAILRKEGALTPEERRTMETHCEIGYQILTSSFIPPRTHVVMHGFSTIENSPFIELASEIALQHHEKFNGAGYPYGLKGSEISLGARVTALADVYDALRSERPYKAAFSELKSLEIIRSDAGTHFDPSVVEAFERCLPVIRSIEADLADSTLREAA